MSTTADNTQTSYDDDTTTTTDDNAQAVFAGVGTFMGIIFLTGIISFILTIIGTVKMTKLTNPTEGIRWFTGLSWVFTLLLPIPFVNLVFPSLLIHNINKLPK
jgi:hypothetical protein